MHGGRVEGQVVNVFEFLADVIGVQDRVFGGLADARAVGQRVGQRAHQHAEISAEGAHAADRLRPIQFPAPAAVLFRRAPESAGTVRGFSSPAPGPRRGRRRRAAWKTSCADSGASRPRRNRRAARRRPARSCWRRPCRAARRARAGFRQLRRCAARNVPSVEGLVTISAATSSLTSSLQMLDVNLAARVGADIFHFVAGNHRGGGIGAVRGVRNQNFLARIALALRGTRESAAGRSVRLARRRRAAA